MVDFYRGTKVLQDVRSGCSMIQITISHFLFLQKTIQQELTNF